MDSELGNPLMREILNKLPAGVVILKTDGKAIFVNRKMMEMNKLFRKDAFNILEFVYGEDRDLIGNILSKAVEGLFDDITSPILVRMRAEDDSVRWNEVRAACIEAYGERLVVLIFTEVTDKMKMQKKLSELNSYLRLVNKMLRHDIMNVFASLLGYSEILKYEWKEVDVADIAKKMEDEIRRGIEIIEKTRSLGSVSDDSLKPVNLREVFEDVLSTYPVKYTINGDATVIANAGLYSVVGNIVDNAIRHGGASEIRVDIKKNDGFAEIRISDNGTSFDEGVADKLFDEGFGEGSGVGLYVVKTFIEGYGGKIRAESKDATFTIKLPLAKEDSQRTSFLSPHRS